MEKVFEVTENGNCLSAIVATVIDQRHVPSVLQLEHPPSTRLGSAHEDWFTCGSHRGYNQHRVRNHDRVRRSHSNRVIGTFGEAIRTGTCEQRLSIDNGRVDGGCTHRQWLPWINAGTCTELNTNCECACPCARRVGDRCASQTQHGHVIKDEAA